MIRSKLFGTLAVASAAALAAASPVRAETPAVQGASNVITLTKDTTSPTQVSVGAYYTQVQIAMDRFKLPDDDDGQRHLGKAILSALNLNNKVRSLTIYVTLSEDGKPFPEIPLITYSFDESKRLTNIDVVDSYVSPRWQLGAAKAISVALSYKYSKQTTYSPTTITNNIKQLIPSEAIVSALGTPFVQSVANFAASVFAAAGTETVNARYQGDLLPYAGAVGARALDYGLALPDGTPLGSIKASLVVSPSLLRPAILTSQASAADLVRRANEDVADLSLNVAGAEKNLLQEAEGLPSYGTMAKGPTPANVKDYCTTANKTLAKYGLTTLDRTTLVYRSMQDAGFEPGKYHPTANTWGADCFSPIDRTALAVAISANFDPPAAPKPAAPVIRAEDRWSPEIKGALGCWVTGKTGPDCGNSARATLEKAFADKVKIGLFQLLPNADDLVPVDRMWDKYSLLDALSGKAEDFSCYKAGLILKKGDVAYVVGVDKTNDLISGIQIQKASDEVARCLKS